MLIITTIIDRVCLEAWLTLDFHGELAGIGSACKGACDVSELLSLLWFCGLFPFCSYLTLGKPLHQDSTCLALVLLWLRSELPTDLTVVASQEDTVLLWPKLGMATGEERTLPSAKFSDFYAIVQQIVFIWARVAQNIWRWWHAGPCSPSVLALELWYLHTQCPSSFANSNQWCFWHLLVTWLHSAGVLVLSEFAGAAQSLGAGAILINPWNIKELADAIRDAVNMEPAVSFTLAWKLSMWRHTYRRRDCCK